MLFDEFLDFQPNLGVVPLKQAAAAYSATVAELANFEPIRTAATFGGLLTRPQLQANCLRLEVLVHLALSQCVGSLTPTRGLIHRCFEALSTGICGIKEDPAEELFLALVNTPKGNFRIFEGLNEGNSFYLQTVLDVVGSMPNVPSCNRLKGSIESLLKLSDEVAARAGVRENSIGEEYPLDRLPPTLASQLSAGRAFIRFTKDDLARLNILSTTLVDFSFDLQGAAKLAEQELGNSDLERRPLLVKGDFVYLVLPSAVGSAIKRLVIEFVTSIDRQDIFEKNVAQVTARVVEDTPFFGGDHRPCLIFQKLKGLQLASVMREVDPGRYLQIILVVGGLNNFGTGGFGRVEVVPDDSSEGLLSTIKDASSKASGNPTFEAGITLLIVGGVGRGLYLTIADGLPDRWRLRSMSANDFVTLGWLPDFKNISLWRLFDTCDLLEREEVTLVNINGLLNLVAWTRNNNGHVVQHEQMPADFSSLEDNKIIIIEQNALRSLRQEVATMWDPRRALNADGRWIRVKKLDPSYFSEDHAIPLYASLEDLEAGRLRAVYVANHKSWWIGISAPDETPTDQVFERWSLLCTWLKRASPVLDEAYNTILGDVISISVKFAAIADLITPLAGIPTAAALRKLISISARQGDNNIELTILEGFDDGLAQADNTAEQILVEAVVTAVAIVAGESSDTEKQLALAKQICPNAHARYMHRFQTQSFRDGMAGEIGRKPTFVDAVDHSACVIGLGWKVYPRTEDPEINGRTECTRLLNAVVSTLLCEICEHLSVFNRRSMLIALLKSHEAAARDRDVWRRTAQASISLHNNKEEALKTIVKHDSQLGVCMTTSRILLEAAICECSADSGKLIGELELSRLMSRALLAFAYGGWSDAIYWGATEPKLKITPLGDVHMAHSFLDGIYQPFAIERGETQIQDVIDNYRELYNFEDIRSHSHTSGEPLFLDAWKAEFGITLEKTKEFIQDLEQKGLQQKMPIFELRRSVVTEMLASISNLSIETASLVLEEFIQIPRPEWRQAPPKFDDRDWQPWRFRRRLSMMRRPLLQLGGTGDPMIVIAPGLVSEAFIFTALSFFRGEISQRQTRSPEMKSWLGHANNVQRIKFNSEVALRMTKLGWKVLKEVKVSGLVGRKLERNYGDIDVLAWQPDVGRILAIECKDLQLASTLGEVAEQLADYRGDTKSDGKPDYLRRHLDRVDVLKSDPATIAKRLHVRAPTVEGHLVFKNAVPMKYAWDHMANRVRLNLVDELDSI